jgi:hypothetical protein
VVFLFSLFSNNFQYFKSKCTFHVAVWISIFFFLDLCPSRIPNKHPSGWELSCIIFSTNCFFMGLPNPNLEDQGVSLSGISLFT